MRALLCLLLLYFAPIGALLASKLINIEFTCPIDEKRFTYQLQVSSYVAGKMLDLKPFGAVVAPDPVPVCPGNGFVMYRDEFTPDEIRKLKTFVASKEYVAVRDADTPYYRIAKLRAFLGDDPQVIAFSLLQATWEARTPQQYRRYAREALHNHQLILAKPLADKNARMNQELVAGELERRLGMFGDAQKRFDKLKEVPEFREGFFAEIVKLQLRLIAAKDSQSHELPYLK